MKLIISIFLFITYSFSLNLQIIDVNITSLNKNQATIAKGNLQIGQSGIITHQFNNNEKMILGYGVVTKTDTNNSTIKLILDDIIPQDAIPTTNLKPAVGDSFVLNHLYDTALLIVPNNEVEQKIKNAFYGLKYIETDILAGYLKLEKTPAPSLELLQSFAKQNNIGLLLFVVEKKLHIVDVISLKNIYSFDITYNDTKTNLPFHTNVEKINTGLFDFFKEESVKDYHKYYTKLLGLNNDGK
jgi:hypothetical protein